MIPHMQSPPLAAMEPLRADGHLPSMETRTTSVPQSLSYPAWTPLLAPLFLWAVLALAPACTG